MVLVSQVRLATQLSKPNMSYYSDPEIGGMPNADIVMGFVSTDGVLTISDRYATGRSRPSVDTSEDLESTSGSRIGNDMKIAFRRKRDTGIDSLNLFILTVHR